MHFKFSALLKWLFNSIALLSKKMFIGGQTDIFKGIRRFSFMLLSWKKKVRKSIMRSLIFCNFQMTFSKCSSKCLTTQISICNLGQQLYLKWHKNLISWFYRTVNKYNLLLKQFYMRAFLADTYSIKSFMVLSLLAVV